jgi:hypothetical protein
MRKPRRGLRTGLYALALVLIGTLAVRTVFAAEQAGGAHREGKGAAAQGDGKGSGDTSGGRPSAGSHDGGGGESGGKGDAHPSQGDDIKGHQGGGPDRGEPAKGAGPSPPSAKDSNVTEPNVEPARRLDKRKGTPGQDNATVQPTKPNLSRRLSPSPPALAPNPVRNAIGITLPTHENVGRHDSTHPSPAVPHPSVAAPAAASAVGRSSETRGINHPAANPAVTPPVANRGAINGTGMTSHNVGPPQIGGPTASAVGINGTTIRPKR